jgi:hypothetical protein
MLRRPNTWSSCSEGSATPGGRCSSPRMTSMSFAGRIASCTWTDLRGRRPWLPMRSVRSDACVPNERSNLKQRDVRRCVQSSAIRALRSRSRVPGLRKAVQPMILVLVRSIELIPVGIELEGAQAKQGGPVCEEPCVHWGERVRASLSGRPEPLCGGAGADELSATSGPRYWTAGLNWP